MLGDKLIWNVSWIGAEKLWIPSIWFVWAIRNVIGAHNISNIKLANTGVGKLCKLQDRVYDFYVYGNEALCYIIKSI